MPHTQSENKPSALTRLPVIVLLAFISCFLWGCATPSIKTGYRLLHITAGDTAAQLLFAGLRFMLAGLMVILAGSAIRGRLLFPKPGYRFKVLPLALLQTVVHYLFLYIGLAHASGVHTAICTSTNVFFSILLATLVFRYEALTARKLLGCLVGFAGVVLINVYGSSGSGGGFRFLGEGFAILASLSYSLSCIFVKEYSSGEDPMVLSGYQFLLGGFILTLIGFALGSRVSGWSAASLAILFFLAFISAMAYTLWSILLKHNPVSRVSVFGFLDPLSGVILSALFLSEGNQVFNAVGLLSLLLVCLGIYTVNKTGKA